MNKLNMVVGGVLVIIGVLVGSYFGGATKTVVEKQGSVVGPDVSSNFLSIGGVERWYYHVPLSNKFTVGSTGTSTICAILSPASTSTLISGSLASRTGATSTATIIDFARSTTINASTTKIGDSFGVASGVNMFNIVASTSVQEIEDGETVFPPSQYFIVKVGGGVGGAYSPQGTCNAVFEVQ